MNRPGVTMVLLGLLSLTITSCGLLPNGGPDHCSTGNVWTEGDLSSPLMHPGTNCIGCHEEVGGKAPKFAIAGTVMNDFKDDSDCGGVKGVTVEITEADGHVVDMTTNPAGNFLLNADRALATPFTVKLTYDGKERAMQSPQSNGACPTCHTADGANGAPGRILVPQ